MASIFTYQEEPPRVQSPWSTPENASPRLGSVTPIQNAPGGSYVTSMTKLEPERQDGPTEYKLHLLLRPKKSALGSSILTPPAGLSPKALSSESLVRTLGEAAVSANSYHTSQQSRQARLQQLTTQLLWRLQQSSPFHSSSNASLVLPMLPEATPKLGIPERPARLLPGLEESQGALYEIGVADDGTLVGLVSEELEESLSNLRAMAASLGCVIDVLRRVLVAQSSINIDASSIGADSCQLWVAEVLVKPEGGSSRTAPLEETGLPKLGQHGPNKNVSYLAEATSRVEQLRVAIVGASTAGKSSLLGTLTTSSLDNGRGKSRLSLLKHRHEITSGITSSVAQELIGYGGESYPSTRVVNYASGDVSSWPDIHNLSSKLVFLSDSPGLPRYAKSAFRTLVSWDAQLVLFCIPAESENYTSGTLTNHLNSSLTMSHGAGDDVDADVSLAHLEMCLKLNLPIMIVVTKMDIATRSGLKATLGKVLSVLKGAGRKPILMSAPSEAIDGSDDHVDIAAQLMYITDTERAQLRSVLDNVAADLTVQTSHVPIVLTSSVNGTGFGKLHALLTEIRPPTRSQPVVPKSEVPNQNESALFYVDEIFAIPPSRVYKADSGKPTTDQGIVLCGHVVHGHLTIGQRFRLGPFWLETEGSAADAVRSSPRSSSYHNDGVKRPAPQPLAGDFSKSLQGERITIAGALSEATFRYVDVTIVSLRSLRLPVRSMGNGETGTVGIQPVEPDSPIPLSRARKGMILSATEGDNLYAYRSFIAEFPAIQFSGSNTPPLILGGHAIVYVNSIRAAVKVTAVHFSEADSSEPSSPIELFNFDGENADDSAIADKMVRITFKFVSSIEWLRPGNKALIVPNTTAAGPISGPPAATITGLSGFVGIVSEVFL